MSVHLIADIQVKGDMWIPGYAAAVHQIVQKRGGKYLPAART